ncbi:MAG: sulfotransferase family protein [Thalassotalea sp.]
MNKIFIIGLPRTATTSVCVAMLELGFTVAHTAYTNNTFERAQVIADTPVFCDYAVLDKTYPNSKFIYLTRDLAAWLPSIKQLLNRMATNLLRDDGGFNPIIKRCYSHVFGPFTEKNINDDNFLADCYKRHQQHIQAYFKARTDDLLILNVADQNSTFALLNFLQLSHADFQFPQYNVGAKVTAWKDFRHPGKIESTNKGKIEKLHFNSSIGS